MSREVMYVKVKMIIVNLNMKIKMMSKLKMLKRKQLFFILNLLMEKALYL